jgi:hypothetical protein
MNAQTAATLLFQNQMAGFASELGLEIKNTCPDIDHQTLDNILSKLCAAQQLDLSALQKTSKSKGSTKPRQRKEVPTECQCQARVWGEKGIGNDQCSLSASNDGLCTRHHKMWEQSSQPCQTTENGNKRLGLFMGRIDQWQDDKEGILPFKDQNGFVRIEWASEDMRAVLDSQLESGEATRPESGLGSTKTKSSTKKKKTQKASAVAETDAAEELSAAVNEPPQEVVSIVDVIADTVQDTTASPKEVGLDEALASLDDEAQSVSGGLDENSEPGSDTRGEEGETEIEEREWEGVTFSVDPSSGTIYYLDCDEDNDEYGAEMGTWTDDGPELTEEWAERLNDCDEDN